MTVINEGLRTGEHLCCEANGYRSREAVLLAAGTYVPGQVLGRVATVPGLATAAAVTGNTGNGVMGPVTANIDAIQGVHLLKVTKAGANAGDFELIDPQGDVVGVGSVGAAFVGGGLSFTLADGAADFAVNDSFRITVGAATVKYKAFDPGANDGAQRASAVLLAGSSATVDVKATAHVRSCEVNALIITWPVGITAPQKTQGIADLATLGIIVRN